VVPISAHLKQVPFFPSETLVDREWGRWILWRTAARMDGASLYAMAIFR